MKKREDDGDEDKTLWKRVADTVRPMRKKPHPAKAMQTKAAAGKSAAKKPAVKHPEVLPPLPRPLRNMAAPAPVAPKPFDRGEEQKLRKGPESFDGKLDLHGMTQGEAYAALHRFVRGAQKSGRRTLLVITGKGRVGGGVLRRQLPLWLEEGELRQLVLAFTPARAKDGGEGAYYIKLRRDKKPGR